jgi:hypothetical protein
MMAARHAILLARGRLVRVPLRLVTSAKGTNTSWAIVIRQKADVQPGTPDQRTKRADHPMANTPRPRIAYALVWALPGEEAVRMERVE